MILVFSTACEQITMLRIDRALAEAIIREEAQHADADPGDPEWIDHIEELSNLCERSGVRTHIAFLGTAILAKTVEPRADLKWIKPSHAKDEPFAFSARTLAENVLVPVAADLGIHIGVTSPQPLNNQPYFRMTYLGDATPISAGGKPAFDYMVALIEKLGPLSAAQSRDALRAYITIRRRYQPRYSDPPGTLHITQASLTRSIVEFVGENSEGGKRAQACVAGLYDAAFGHANVVSGRINDPSRDHPGDVCIQNAAGSTIKAIEVKDKIVSFNDVQIFGKKVVDMGVRDASYVMVASGQTRLDEERLTVWADGFGLALTLFYDWPSLATQATYWAYEDHWTAIRTAANSIRRRLIAVEAHPESVDRWDAALKAAK